MSRKQVARKPRIKLHEIPSQLDRIEGKVDAAVRDLHVVRSRVDKLEAKATLWGSLGGILIGIASHLAGCL